MVSIYHITSQKQWKEARQKSTYSTLSLNTEGFIHCSTYEQIIPVANHHYHSIKDLVIMQVSLEKLLAEVKFEGIHKGIGQQFPHIYGEINLNAVEGVYPFPVLEDGTFKLPQELVK